MDNLLHYAPYFIAFLALFPLLSKQVRQNTIDGLKLADGGFSVRKFAGIYSFIIAGLLSTQIEDPKLKTDIVYAWQVTGCLCFAIVTGGQALSFWLRKPEDKSEEAKN